MAGTHRSGSTANTQWVALSDSVDLLALQRNHPQRYPYLLESVAHGEQNRFSILFAFPEESLQLNADGLWRDGDRLSEQDFLTQLDADWRAQGLENVSPGCDFLPFTGGWFLYLGYELAAQVEPTVNFPASPFPLPTAIATRIPAAIIHDHQQQQSWLVAEHEAAPYLPLMREDCREQTDSPASSTGHSIAPPPLGSLQEEDPRQYIHAVEKTLQYIHDGDLFQANLSRRWEGALLQPYGDSDLYARLRQKNPGPFNGLMLWEDCAIISSSPERLVSVREGLANTRPIAGTRPRSGEMEKDQALSTELLGNPKERAEHVMLIDLERNDLGRVCVPGSVRVNELMVLESYAHVHHIVSNVQGRLRTGITPGEVIRAVFPGGTITGCPKVRCMEVIAELEHEGRGPYTGSMGYLNRNGSLDLNILIRTLIRNGTSISLRAGGGIVADSDARRELEETRAKARGMLLALQEEVK